eukprot:gb/GECH01009422.1/.p1 GENE.gb/GECH01009422.1/~~gb/GECH01009422.1/.p1  ORF type:complete len:268 (+),score=32.82 gb/GECH01009422.1/:1-804(+)
MKCRNGHCKPHEEGDVCTPPQYHLNGIPVGVTCNTGLFCKRDSSLQYSCAQSKKENEKCDSNEKCSQGLFCNKDQVCQKLFSLEKGKKCTSNKECRSGLICFIGLEEDTCQEAKDPKLTSCSFDSDCGSGSCACYPGFKQPYCDNSESAFSDCNQEEKRVVDCALDHECPSIGVCSLSNTCIYSKCRSQVDDYNACFYKRFMSVMKDSCVAEWVQKAANQDHHTTEIVVGSVFGVLSLTLVVIGVVVVARIYHRRRKNRFVENVFIN